jgi:CRP-like cAMP-binding protein
MKTSHVFLTFQPRLKPHTFKPSDDNPTEYVLILEENGAALGITLKEKRLLQLFEEKLMVRAILNKIVQEEISSLTLFKNLLWDLDRYGFLEESPWPGKHDIEEWGYWGFPTSTCAPFPIHSFLQPLEKWIGKGLLSPLYFVVVSLALTYALIDGKEVFNLLTPFLLNDSVATALLVVLVSILACCLFSAVIMTVILHSIHPNPVRCLIDYRYGLPVFRLDGRRLRALSWKKTLRAILSPVFTLLLFSSITLAWASRSDGLLQEWLFHITLSFWLSSFLLTTPWISSMATREVMLRLRGESSFWTLTHALKNAFRRNKKTRNEDLTYQRLFLGWGIISILTTAALVTALGMAMPWNLSLLFTHFMREQNPIIIAILFLLLSFGGAAIATTIVTFTVWLVREIAQEIQYRFLPSKDYLLTSLLFLFCFASGLCFFWNNANPAILHGLQIAVGITFLCTITINWIKDGRGHEPFIHLFLLVTALLSILHTLDVAWLYHLDSFFQSYFFQALTVHEPLIRQSLHLAQIIILFFFTFYISTLYGFKLLRHSHTRQTAIPKALLYLGGVSLAAACISFLPGQNTLTAVASRDILAAFILFSFACLAWKGSLRNHSTTLFLFSTAVMSVGIFWTQHPLQTPAILLTGYLLGLCGLLLRITALHKTALGKNYTARKKILDSDWQLQQTLTEVIKASERLYHAAPRILIPNEINEDIARRILHHLSLFTGPRALQAILRRAALYSPWQATRNLSNLLPVTIKIPRLSEWTQNRISLWLKKVPSFYHAQEEIPVLSDKARLAYYHAGETLAMQNEQEGFLFVLLEGLLAAQSDHAFGHSVLAIFEPGDFVGEIGFLSGTRRTASIRALQPCLTLVLHRDDIDESTPKTLQAIKKAEEGAFWLQVLENTSILREFAPSLSARVCLEGLTIHIHANQEFHFSSSPASHSVAVFISGNGTILKEGKSGMVTRGMLIGVSECLEETPLTTVIQAASDCHLLLIHRDLFLEALIELLTPKFVIEYAEEIGMFQVITN